MSLPSTSFASLEQLLCRGPGNKFIGTHQYFFQAVHPLGDDGKPARDREPEFVNMFLFVRLCWKWQLGECTQRAEICHRLHLCRNWIAGQCAAGPDCALGHSFECTWITELPILSTWSAARIAEFIYGSTRVSVRRTTRRAAAPSPNVTSSTCVLCSRSDSAPTLRASVRTTRSRRTTGRCSRSIRSDSMPRRSTCRAEDSSGSSYR